MATATKGVQAALACQCQCPWILTWQWQGPRHQSGHDLQPPPSQPRPPHQPQPPNCRTTAVPWPMPGCRCSTIVLQSFTKTLSTPCLLQIIRTDQNLDTWRPRVHGTQLKALLNCRLPEHPEEFAKVESVVSSIKFALRVSSSEEGVRGVPGRSTWQGVVMGSESVRIRNGRELDGQQAAQAIALLVAASGRQALDESMAKSSQQGGALKQLPAQFNPLFWG